MTEMNIYEVLRKLPQRYPFIMVDRVLECEPGRRLVALKNVSANEPYFPGHFPGRPIMPGVLILEAMAQACCLLAFRTLGEEASPNEIYLFAGVDNARFKRMVIPGDRLELEATLVARKRGLWKFACTARVDGQVTTEAEVLCTRRAMDADGA